MLENYLMNFRMKLLELQVGALLEKIPGSSNPLWLKTACEELRVVGDCDGRLNSYIASIPETLNELVDIFEVYYYYNFSSLSTFCTHIKYVSNAHAQIQADLYANCFYYCAMLINSFQIQTANSVNSRWIG